MKKTTLNILAILGFTFTVVSQDNITMIVSGDAIDYSSGHSPHITLTNSPGIFDIDIDVTGGGISSQAEASRLAIAKAMVEYGKGEKLKEIFLGYDRNLLVADVRRKEAAKPNRHGQARAKVQKSYR